MMRLRRQKKNYIVLPAASHKWMISNCWNATPAISLDIAAMTVKKIINLSTKRHARNERLNYVMSCYLSNRKAHISGTARSA
eukprot:scaffold16385_cov73-Skeletonema_dohrnii-CCMP3373.AAC.6